MQCISLPGRSVKRVFLDTWLVAIEEADADLLR